MSNETLIRQLIRGSIQRAIQESVAAVFVILFFGALLPYQAAGSPRFFGCLLILMGTAFILGVVWSFVLSSRLLRTHDASDTSFWRAAFHSQARLLRLAPVWYCAPIFAGCMLFAAPTAAWEAVPYLLLTLVFLAVFGAVAWLNRRAAAQLDQLALQLGPGQL
jgi:cytochrome c biogenesis protein CcdA